MNLALVGVNTISNIVIEQLNKDEYDKVYFYDDDKKKIGRNYMGGSVKGPISQIQSDFSLGLIDRIHICFGEKLLVLKQDLFEKYRQLGMSFPNFIDDSCLYPTSCDLGVGNMMNFGCILGHNVKLGNNNSIWSGSVIEHDCKLGESVYIGPNVTLSGFVEIENSCLIGSGSVILPGIKIGANSIIGAGSVVTKDVPNGSIIKGNPAK